jgi:hypothetical protein
MVKSVTGAADKQNAPFGETNFSPKQLRHSVNRLSANHRNGETWISGGEPIHSTLQVMNRSQLPL